MVVLLFDLAAKRVAFSASLLGPNTHQGPFDEETNLIFGNVITNVGNAYNASTGTVFPFFSPLVMKQAIPAKF